MPKSRYRYSSLADQFGLNFFSSLAPAVSPPRVGLSDTVVAVTVIGAPIGVLPSNSCAVSVGVVANLTSPTAKPPVRRFRVRPQ